MELNKKQKELIIDYTLSSLGKGFFESVDEFWEGMTDEQIDDLYPAYKKLANEFVEEIREIALKTL